VAKLLEKFDEVLALDIVNSEKYLNEQSSANAEIPEEILQLVEERKKAKTEKNYELADKLRNEINEKGFAIKDGANGEVSITKI